MSFASHTLYYDHELADAGGLKAATIIVDTDTYEVDIMLVEPGGKQAPYWFDAFDLERVVDQIREILFPTEDGAVEVLQPRDPAFHLVSGPVFPAESLTTARHMMVDFTPDMPNLFAAFTVEFRPNLKLPGTFPVAVFVFDPRESRLVGHVYAEENPFAPASLTRQQQRLISARMAELLRTATSDGSPDRPVSPFTNMGPQFRSESLPTVEGFTIEEALDAAVAVVQEWGSKEAS